MRSACVAAGLLAGCFGTGSLDLELVLPAEQDLKPTGMTTVTVLATSPEMDPIANRTVLTGNSFSAGELPVGDDVQINVLLNDVSNRLVGVGEAPERVDIDGEKATTVTIPVRRPFIYASDDKGLYTFDPTLDARDAKFQGKVAGVTRSVAGVSVGGDRFVVAGSSQMQVIDTATHKVIGASIALPGAVNDIASVPGMRKVAVAHGSGIAVVDIDSGVVANAAVGAVDRVTVGAAADGKLYAYGLVGRVAPRETPFDACTGTSSLLAVSIDTPSPTPAKPLAAAVSAIATPSAEPGVFVTLPCAGQVARVDGDPTSEIGALTLTMMSQLSNAATLAVLGDRIYAAGATSATSRCITPGGNELACTDASSMSCPDTGTPSNKLVSVRTGARLLVQSMPSAGGETTEVELPERRETMISFSDPSQQLAQVLPSLGIVPLDLVVVPGGQYVSVVSRSSYYIASRFDAFGNVVLPCLKTETSDWINVDMASTSVAQRVRTYCDITETRTAQQFNMWQCDLPPDAERPTQGAYRPVAVGALFGAR